MRKLVIRIPRTSYTPGEEICGSLELVSDKPFNSKGTSISIHGVLQAKGVAYSDAPKGKTLEERSEFIEILHSDALALSKARRYEAGTHRFDFSFKLPTSTHCTTDNLEISSGLCPSYDGKHASIEYSIQAEIEVSRLRNVTAKTPISVFIPLARSRKELQISVVEKGEEIMEFESDNTALCIGDPYELRCSLLS